MELFIPVLFVPARFISFVFLGVISCVGYAHAQTQNRVTLSSLLEELTDYEAVTRWPASTPGYEEYMASSYDRRSVSPDSPGWYANSDFSQYIRAEAHTDKKEQVGATGHIQHIEHIEQVMLDTDGPGAIVRFWLTTTENRSGVLRIYLDHQKKPVLTINGYDLMQSHLPLIIPHSSYEPHGKGGSTMYLPIPFSSHCKVTWEEKALRQHQIGGQSQVDSQAQRQAPPRYYQINYRKYEAGTKVRSFNPDELPALAPLIKKTEFRLWHPAGDNHYDRDGQLLTIKKTLPAGKTAAASLPDGARAIRYLELNVATAGAEPDAKAETGAVAIATAAGGGNIHRAEVLRSIFLNISFDGQRTVYCPLSDFSGVGVGDGDHNNAVRLDSWYRTVAEDGSMISRWIMPYNKQSEITFENNNRFPVVITAKVRTRKIHWLPSTLYFHASWHLRQDAPVTKWDSTGASDLHMADIKGKGVYMGNTLSVLNHMHTWYGEGDQKLWRDRLPFPIEFGTGLEDYYNTSWAPVQLYQTPFANAPRADNPDSYGFNTFTRTRNLDAVPFDSEFHMTLEMLGWQSGNADFASTIYWYGFKGATDYSAYPKSLESN